MARTKDQIIEYQSRLLLDFLKIGQDKMQEVSDLLCEIEMLPKNKPATHSGKMIKKRVKKIRR